MTHREEIELVLLRYRDEYYTKEFVGWSFKENYKSNENYAIDAILELFKEKEEEG